MTRWPWVWPAIISISAIAVGLGTLAGIKYPLHSLIALWFLLICPGMAFVRLLHVEETLIEFTLAIALSLALDAIVAMTLLYTGMWSPKFGLLILIGISMGGAALQVIMAGYCMRMDRTDQIKG